MAQNRFLQYKDPVDSFKANQKHLGILEPGRYRGFDTLVAVSALGFDLRHDITGIVQTMEDPTQQTAKTGVLVTPAGLVIQEDADIVSSGVYSNLTIQTNGSNVSKRYDLVICEHEYTEVVGGQNAQYSVIKGPENNPVQPALPNPKTQIVVGVIEIPAGATTLAGAVWTPSTTPALGNASTARLDKTNAFTKASGLAYGTLTTEVVGDDVAIVITNNGNRFRVDWNFEITNNVNISTKLWDGSGNPLGAIAQIKEVGNFPEGSEIDIVMQGLTSAGKKGIRVKSLSSLIATGKIEALVAQNAGTLTKFNDGTILKLSKKSSDWVLIGVNFGGKWQSTNYIYNTYNIEEAVEALDKALNSYVKSSTVTYTP